MSSIAEKITNTRLRALIQDVFDNPENGTPDNISQSGCVALAKQGYEAWNAWREAFPVYFEGEAKNIACFGNCDAVDKLEYLSLPSLRKFKFGVCARFQNLKFNVGICFDQSEFGSKVVFKNLQFDFGATFYNARFEGSSNFQNINFIDGSSFYNAIFGCDAQFENCNFLNGISFGGAKFLGNCFFSTLNFHHGVSFFGVQSSKLISFSLVNFYSHANFEGCDWEKLKFLYPDHEEFEREQKLAQMNPNSPSEFNSLSFYGCDFYGEAEFSNRKFKGKTIFGGDNQPTNFASAPKFHNCEFYQDTGFENVKFPLPSGDPEAQRAYRTLKLAFNKMQAMREEQLFFKLELAEEAKASSYWNKILYHSYYALSNFGFSVSKPIFWCLFSIIFFFFSYSIALHFAHCNSGLDCHFRTNWLSFNTLVLKFSLTNALPLPGIEKIVDLKGCNIYASSGFIGWVITLLIFIQKLFSLVLLFLIGLGLKNLFKFK